MTDNHPAIYSAAVGISAGAIVTGIILLFSKGWMRLNSYNQTILGIGIIHMYASLLLVLFFAGCCIPFILYNSSRRTILLHAALTGLIAAGVARILPFVGRPAYLISSLLSTIPQLLIILACGLLVVVFGGLFASFIRKDEEQGFAPLIPLAIVTIAVIILPLLLVPAGISTGIIPPTSYDTATPVSSHGSSMSVVAYRSAVYDPPTDLWVLKLSPEGAIEWEQTVDISTYDRADALTESPAGYAIAATESGQEYLTVHLVRFDSVGAYTRLPGTNIEFSPVTSIVPAPDDGFLLATETPEIMHITTTGETLWRKSLANGSQGMAPVSLLARDDGTFVAAWADQTACLDANGTMLWDVSPDAIGSGPSLAILTEADNGGVLVCTEGKHIRANNQYMVYPVVVCLSADGTVMWDQSFGSGIADTLLGVWQNGTGHTILYRTITFPKNLWGNVVHAYTSHLISLSDDGTVTGFQEIPDSGGDVIPSLYGGFLSLDTGESTITGTGYNAGGQELWTREYDVQANPYSLRGIGTTDGGYLIAVSSPS
ncbi:PQQ-binding-like beta-propeller repeat protein [Methanogenium organophilum]|uniref:PQQ-binding-like beta-propeller repeat protein n=1 Tax=Methanogenium organophilum TaxID=2199 RepID=A0A9X9T8C7_METOG|nr:PQQ-binding-like beta-propeller repeat protein [Methanogenium organophilum]WAI02034.1 PQQ-binding-like beta-propeller repeat protein [Methanogenium organophilum]